ncbi:EAL domain-containing protein [Cohnella lupini]|uniref:PAS domain S-box-containing protein/diguanylate cyclase (GGDEF)-like protein n=1 Tax=Cohnella lupini TaxID=1294267 RepID=A0A3D9IA02_9BACL|nr:EAL domain-containing protein [Cohnella lupini]RED58006.1 PAS domain S-box-containing protein/diguanylate cyclase (GGDEF)-like protein [Cohnella lupini]
MVQGYRIGVIAPHLDGEYYGRLLPHMHQAVRERQSQLFAIQVADDYLGITALDEPIAFDLVDAWILILPSASASFLEMLGNSDKPFVCVGFQSPYPQGYSVLADNRTSMKTAVCHLIDHGHMGIAFVGNVTQYDLYERYLGYRDALEERGLPFDERLVVRTDDNLLESGHKATEQLLLGDIPFTAFAAGTDLNALGIIDCLQSRGYSVPKDFAVIGYDDIHQAAVNYPSLSTIRQPFEAMANEAVRIAFEMLEKGKPDARESIIPARLVIRSSCGCAERTQFSSAAEFDHYMQSLSQLRISLHNITVNNYKMTQGLILATKDDKIHISKLFWNLSHWGCLALWEEDANGEKQLVVRQAFSKNGDRVPPVGKAYPLHRFPPVDFLPPGTQPGGEDVVILHPVKSDLQNWGYIALAGPLDPLNNFVANDLSRHSFTILAVALERELLFDQIRSIAEKLEIVSRTTNDGIWDWNLETNKIHWNIRAHNILSRTSMELTNEPRAFMKLVHREDRKALRLCFVQPYRTNHPIQLEFRIRGEGSHFSWIYMAGDIVWNDAGKAIRIIGSMTDITEKKDNEARITQLAYQDALTGLPNRLLYKDELNAAMKERDRDGKKLAVMMIDLDRFKIVNDTQGHQTGDMLLQQVAQELNACVKESDIIARLGGDEFIVLLSRIEGVEEVVTVADKMLRMLTKPFLLEGQKFYLSASVGACIYPCHGENVDSLIRYADLAMYHTKENGGNRLEIYTPALSSKRVERFNMESGLRYALERGELALNFQPQVSLSTGKVHGAETLLRWNTPDGKTIQPGEFIPLAEETSLIIPIGQWVLEQACLECRRWIRAGMPSLVISVNISALQFQQENFPELVRKVLRDTGIEPFNLCLEITEHTAVQNMEHSISMLGELVEIGVKIAIDDFGIGQSSLLLLKKLPVHIVKLDPSFILNMIEDSDDDAIAKAIIEMSHSLGLSVTAEGVETEGQLHRLQQLQCDRIQGFFTGRPMTSDQFIAYFLEISSWMS